MKRNERGAGDFLQLTCKLSPKTEINKEVNRLENKKKGKMSVEEAGRLGGERTAQTHGEKFYSEIGHKGGQKVRRLIEEGKQREKSM